MQETQEPLVPPLGREDPREKDVATHSSVLAWRIPWTEEPDGLQSVGCGKESDTAEATQYTICPQEAEPGLKLKPDWNRCMPF